ncbi:MAG TPA: hypothetical protein VEB43_15705 [Anaeromyxobacter sp.]|nr:hypothetical protein [Anaeromyxobacter sp.]
MQTIGRWGRVAAIAALLAPVIAGANEFSGEKVVPMSKDGIVAVGLEVGPVVFQEILVQGAPSDPEAIAALPGGKKVSPRASVVATHRGHDEVLMKIGLTFQDDAGVVYLRCSRELLEQDEDTTNEVSRACDSLSPRSLPAADWAKVTAVRLVVSLVETD